MIHDFISSDNLSDEQMEELSVALDANTDEFTTLKFIEELAELQEKLIKYHLKSKEHKPKMKDILDEIGDVTIRLVLFVDRHAERETEYDVMDYLEKRVDKKLEKMHGYVQEGKYKGGL